MVSFLRRPLRPIVGRLYRTPRARLFALSGAMRAWWFTRVVAASVAAGVLAWLLAREVEGRPAWLVFLGAFVVTSLVAQWALLGFTLRAALETFQWVVRWEWERAKPVLGGRVPRTPRGLERLLAEEHEPHPVWVELLLIGDRHEEAAAVAEALPQATTWERFERALNIAWVEWVTSGSATTSAAVDAAAELAGDERALAEAMLALAEARKRLVAGDDWLQPLAAARDAGAKGVLLRSWWPARLRSAALLGAALTVVFALVS